MLPMKKEYRWLLVFAGALAFTLSNAFSIAQDERFGIWGGLSERERRKLKRAAG